MQCNADPAVRGGGGGGGGIISASCASICEAAVGANDVHFQKHAAAGAASACWA